MVMLGVSSLWTTTLQQVFIRELLILQQLEICTLWTKSKYDQVSYKIKIIYKKHKICFSVFSTGQPSKSGLMWPINTLLLVCKWNLLRPFNCLQISWYHIISASKNKSSLIKFYYLDWILQLTFRVGQHSISFWWSSSWVSSTYFHRFHGTRLGTWWDLVDSL